MTAENCEAVRLSAMAIEDGETPPIPAGRVEEHLRSCADCRREVARMQEATRLLGEQERLPREDDLWPGIARRLESPAPGPSWRPFALVGVALVACKMLRLLPGLELAAVLGLLSLLPALALFLWLRENPFKIALGPTVEGGVR